MSPSAQLTAEQLKEIIEDKKKTDQDESKDQEQLDGEEVLNPDNTCSVLSTALNSINNESTHDCLDEEVRLPNTHPNRQSTDGHVPIHQYGIPALPRTKNLVHQV